MLQDLYRRLRIYSHGYIVREAVVSKLVIGLFFIGLAIYGILANVVLLVLALCVFLGDYLIYRAFMSERFFKVEECARKFNVNKLLQAEGAQRVITEEELRNPDCSEETEYILENIRKERFRVGGLGLDIGCGQGALTLGILKIGIETISIDITLRALEFTGEILKRNGLSSSRVLADAQHLPFRNACIDLVVASSVIEHLPDDIMGFSETARVLKRHGKAIFSFPSCHSPVFSLSGFLFNPIIVLERLISWKLPSVLPRRSKFVYLGELFLTRDKASFNDVSIHRLYDQKTVNRVLESRGLSARIVGFISSRGRKLSLGRFETMVRERPYLAHVFVVFCVKQ